MSKNYLHREDAPFGDEVWKRIDECVVGAAKSQLCGRRLLHIEGPYGLGLKSLPTADEIVAEKSAVHGVDLFSGSPVPVLGIQGRFTLGARDIASFEQTGLPFDTAPVAEAAIA